MWINNQTTPSEHIIELEKDDAIEDIIELDKDDAVVVLLPIQNEEVVEIVDRKDEDFHPITSPRTRRQRNWVLSKKLEILDIFKAKVNTETVPKTHFDKWIRKEYNWPNFGKK